MIFNLVWADKKALKSFEKLPKNVQERIRKAIKQLAAEPKPLQAKQLSGDLKGAWRLRIGDYRLLYDIDDVSLTVTLIYIAHRRKVYR